jgi:hypothetical protein
MAAAAAADAAEAQALAFLAGFEEMDRTLLLCGFTRPVQRFRLIDQEGLDTLESFGDIPDETFDRTARTWESKDNRNRISFGIGRLQKLKAVAFWVRKCQREGMPINVQRMGKEKLLAEKEERQDAKLYYPPPFDYKKYIQWERSLENYLDSRRGRSKIPLSYVIRPDDVNPEEAETEYERVLWSAPHEGIAFEEDNREAYRIYKDLMNGTDGWAWFNQAQVGNGREAHQVIVDHYRGTPEVARRAAEAEAALEKLHYINENAVSFEEYVSRMTEQFELLEDNDQGLSETQKVKQFLKGILSTHPDVRGIISQIRSQFSTNFYEASKHFAGQLSLIPGYMVKGGTGGGRGDHAKRRISALDAERQHDERMARNRAAYQYYCLGAGRSRGCGGNRGQHNRQYKSGVDVTDPHRTFSPEEYARLRQGGHITWLANVRWNNGGRPRHNRGGRGRRGGRGHGREQQGRQVSFLEHAPSEGQTTMQQSTEMQHQRGGNAGARFGGRRYGNGPNR